MKAGLVTFYHLHHYGALLQAVATQQALANLGWDCETIDYFVNQDNRILKPPTSPGRAASDAHSALHYKALRTRWLRFESFSKAHLHLTSRYYESRDALFRENWPYDLIIAGSDQIWNPVIFPDGRFDPAFFGAFSSLRKIAYAPSFGVPRIPEGMEAELRGYLDAFSHLSVRESQGREIIREIAGREAQVVLDPTLLPTAEDWSALASPQPEPKGSYLLCYCINSPGALEPYIRQMAEKTGLPVVQLCGTRRRVHPKARMILDAGPAEFLSLFQNAAFVCTNSFHGTVFSIQFQRPFFTSVAPAELQALEHSRTYSLLSRLGLTERIVGKGDAAALDDSIDWPAVKTHLEDARQSSLAYLRAALADVPVPEESPQNLPADPRLADRAHCTGCSACRNICPRDAIILARDREGFAYPAVNPEACVHCGRCTAVCPALEPRRASRPLPAAFAAWNQNGDIRRDSTSGGAFSALADYVLEGGGVVFGAAMDARQHLRHTACFQKEDLWRLRGAKYVQSDLDTVFRDVKKCLETRQVLFSGTPCQVDGLYHYLGGRPENLTTCDLVCQGVPSPGVWEDMVRHIEGVRGRTLQTVRFRNKVEGWKNSHFTAVYDDGTADTHPLFQTEYGRAFGRALFLRPCCYRCAYTNLNRPGDFTLGDFWGLSPDELPEQQQKGISLLLVNTPHGSHIFDQLPLRRQPFPVERAVAGNPRLAVPVAQPAGRGAFFAAYALQPFDEVLQRFCALPPLPVRAVSRVLSPEVKTKLRKLLRK
ncbi:MAG: 4Fe-4S dicluster domain-containing protein [Oscillibacter sp.]|nr:4Fe-4S dicluster domain-containing protein [Oscillibacter sp.]